MARKASGTFNQSQYINDFMKDNYDKINLTMPKGKKEIITRRAKEEGKSVNDYIRGLIYADIEHKKGSSL